MAKAPTHDSASHYPNHEHRLAALEDAVKIIATTLYAPNGGGTDHVEAAAALYASLIPADPEAAEEPTPEPAVEAQAEPDPAVADPAQA
jgi:hypothetical protein